MLSPPPFTPLSTCPPASLRPSTLRYAKSGSAGSASADQLFTMQKTELTNLSMDCGLATEDFNATRVINIFERANQVIAISLAFRSLL